MMLPARSKPTARTAVAAVLVALALAGCSAAQDAAQGAQDAASQKASQAVDDAKSKASARASEFAVQAVRTQLCNLVQDGAVSDADAAALKTVAAAATEVGLPAELLSVAETVADSGTAATRSEVADLKAKACAASS
jgi:hypothetical protein